MTEPGGDWRDIGILIAGGWLLSMVALAILNYSEGADVTEYLLDRYPDGTYETFEYDDDTGDITVRRWADVQPVIDANKAAHLDGDGKGRDMWLAARIPNDVALLWKQLYGVDAWRAEHWPAVKRLLNDPDYRYLRPTSFRL